MGLNAFQLEKYAAHLSETLRGEYLSKAIMIDETVFCFALSRSGRLYINLDASDPCLYVLENALDVNSINHPLASYFRKEFSHAQILGFSTVPEDRVLLLDLLIVDDLFQKAKRTLVLELIPHHPNLLVLDEEKRILIARRYGSLTDARPILRGLTYTEPEKKGSLDHLSHDFDLASYLESCAKKESQLKDRRKKNRFKELLNDAKSKIKASDRKINAIEKDIEEAKKHLEDGQYGSYIYTCMEEIHPETGKMDFYGEAIPLDARKSAVQNAESFFARAKKAKATIQRAETNLARALNEKERYETLLSMVLSSDESSLESLAKEYDLEHVQDAVKKSPLAESASLPYGLIYEGVTYLFGKTAVQNDYLSFLYATKKDRLWFHVKDRRGAHLILQKDDPSDEEITHACEFALLASKLDNGEVQYTLHKNVRRGSAKGQAILKTYQSALIRSIPDEIKNAFSSAKKISLK